MESNQQPNGSSNQGNNPNEQPNQSSSQEDRPLTEEEETQYQQMRVVNSARQLTIALWLQREANRIMDELRSQLPPREDWIGPDIIPMALFWAAIFFRKNVCSKELINKKITKKINLPFFPW